MKISLKIISAIILAAFLFAPSPSLAQTYNIPPMLKNKSFFLRDTGAIPEFIASGADFGQDYKFNGCTATSCGPTTSNPTKFIMASGGVIIGADGEIEIGINSLKVRATGLVAANKTLEVFLGNLIDGTIST